MIDYSTISASMIYDFISIQIFLETKITTNCDFQF